MNCQFRITNITSCTTAYAIRNYSVALSKNGGHKFLKLNDMNLVFYLY